MVFTLPDDAFLSLKLDGYEKQALAQQAQQALAQQAQQVVQETIASNDDFTANGMRIPNLKQWKLVKTKESFRVYRERQSKAELENNRSYSDNIQLPEFVDRTTRLFSSVSTITESIDYLPTVVGFGTIDGTLDDIMYGSFTADDESWRLKSSYVNDRIDGAKVLATIHGPTNKDPYRFLGAKWFTYELPIGVGAVMQRRDFVILEATGLARDSKGNQVGYCLYQSTEFPEVPELKSMKVIRGFTSICFVFRTVTPSTIGIFCRGFLDGGGSAPVSLCAALMSESLAATLDIIECAYMKKLSWAIKHKQREQLNLPRARTNSCATSCYACKRSVNKMTSFASGANCRICLAMVRSKCSVTKKVVVDASSHNAPRKPLAFCLKCFLVAKNTPARAVAEAEWIDKWTLQIEK